MADNENETEEGANPPQVTPAEAIDQLKTLFSTLVPPETLEIEDAFGNKYLTRASIPARAQIKVMQQLDKIWEVDTGDLALSQGAEGIGGISRLVVSLCTNEVLFEGVCGAFSCAHPKVLAEAKKAAVASGVSKKDASHPADLFPLEEIVAGVIPFFIRLASRAVTLMGKVTSQPELKVAS